ncbi:hypothetical protein Bca4012_057450 [Brassica carinata]
MFWSNGEVNETATRRFPVIPTQLRRVASGDAFSTMDLRPFMTVRHAEKRFNNKWTVYGLLVPAQLKPDFHLDFESVFRLRVTAIEDQENEALSIMHLW